LKKSKKIWGKIKNKILGQNNLGENIQHLLDVNEQWISFSDYEIVRSQGVNAGDNSYVGFAYIYKANGELAYSRVEKIEPDLKRCSVSNNGQF
jgi:hypothetical protein